MSIDMKLEISPYIHIFERSGHYYLFNTVNNFFCEIDTETYHNLKDNNQTAFSRDEIKFLLCDVLYHLPLFIVLL